MESQATNNHLLKEFGRLVKTARQHAQLSQSQLAEKAGIHENYVGYIERAEREVGIGKAIRLARVVNLSIDELIVVADHAG